MYWLELLKILKKKLSPNLYWMCFLYNFYVKCCYTPSSQSTEEDIWPQKVIELVRVWILHHMFQAWTTFHFYEENRFEYILLWPKIMSDLFVFCRCSWSTDKSRTRYDCMWRRSSYQKQSCWNFTVPKKYQNKVRSSWISQSLKYVAPKKREHCNDFWDIAVPKTY